MEKKNIRRSHYFIEKEFQAEFIIKFCSIVILASLIIGLLVIFLSQGSTTVTIENTRVLVKNTSDFIFPIMLQTLIIATVLSSLSVIILTLFTSHKIAGPLYRLKKEIELFKRGNLSPSFRIRSKDQLQGLANALSDLANSFKDKHKALRDKALELKVVLQTSHYDRDAINAKLKEIEDILNYFKI
ncbi:MAG: hypothetical protein ISS45_09090 [Candidatus Omnitrophica bacterium]|nr:hypothetical protein [Candidatus Omnitrophota bacterium]